MTRDEYIEIMRQIARDHGVPEKVFEAGIEEFMERLPRLAAKYNITIEDVLDSVSPVSVAEIAAHMYLEVTQARKMQADARRN